MVYSLQTWVTVESELVVDELVSRLGVDALGWDMESRDRRCSISCAIGVRDFGGIAPGGIVVVVFLVLWRQN